MAGPASLVLRLLVALAVAVPLQASLYDPHVPTFYDPAFRTWFEGWYVRITVDQRGSDPTSGLPSSLALIVGHMPRGRLGWNISLASLLIQRENGPLRVLESFAPQLSATTADGELILRDPQPHTPPNFAVKDEDGELLLRMRGDECTIHVQLGDAVLDVNCTGSPDRWGPNDGAPEGSAEDLPTQVMGSHWFVYSLGTPVAFTLRNLTTGSITPGAGSAHFEKNWGGTFPGSYVWAQGVDLGAVDGRATGGAGGEASGGSIGDDATAVPNAATTAGTATIPRPRAVLALAGGQLPSPVLPGSLLPEAWLLGVRSPGGRAWDFRPQDPTVYVATPSADSCNASFTLRAQAPWEGRGVVVSLAAPPTRFGALACPTEEGFRSASSVQAFSATARVEMYVGTPGWWGGDWRADQLVEVFELESTALEFGGARACAALMAAATRATTLAGGRPSASLFGAAGPTGAGVPATETGLQSAADGRANIAVA